MLLLRSLADATEEICAASRVPYVHTWYSAHSTTGTSTKVDRTDKDFREHTHLRATEQ